MDLILSCQFHELIFDKAECALKRSEGIVFKVRCRTFVMQVGMLQYSCINWPFISILLRSGIGECSQAK